MTNLDVTINNSPIQTVSNVSYLGVKISQDLSWDSQINSTCKKLGHDIYMLRKLKDKVPINDLITIHKTIIQPHIDYCLTVWGYAPSNQLLRVQMSYYKNNYRFV